MFKIGDRVVVKRAHPLKGRTGTVVLLPNDKGDASYIRNGFGIEFDEPHGLLHSCRGKTKRDCGAWIMPENLKLIKSEKKVKERKMFKIGDKVRVIKKYYGANEGDEGVIKALPKNNGVSKGGEFEKCYSVEFPKWSGGHKCNGTVPSGHGHWVMPECLELIKSAHSEKIVITHDGKTTFARLYEDNKVVKSAEANCNPKDEFNFLDGAKIAFERLTDEEKKEEPPFKVGDVVKVKAATYHFFMDGTLGRVVGLEGKLLDVRAYRPNQDDIIRQSVRAVDCEKV